MVFTIRADASGERSAMANQGGYMHSISISIVIPVYNGGDSFRRCLTSIFSSLRPADEVIVVSDGGADRSWQIAEAFDRVKVLRLRENGGPARARNVGASVAKGDILFFVDADVTLHEDTLGLIEQCFERSPNLSALIGSYDDAPGASNFLSQYKNLFHHYTHQISSESISTFWGACGAIRQSAFHAVGGFDERYKKPCIEDIELGYRLTQAGYVIHLYKHIQVKHLKQWTIGSLLKAEIFYRALPWTALLLQQQNFNRDLNLSAANRLSVICVFLLCLALPSTLFFALIANLTIHSWMLLLLVILIFLAVTLLTINIDVYRFFYAKRGVWFALCVIPWHWFYFFYGGAAFGYGTVRYAFGQFGKTNLRPS